MPLKSTSGLWMGVAFGAALVLAAAVVAINGTNPRSIRLALDVTARWSFLLFWMSYTVTAMAVLIGPGVAPLAQRGREFGLVFAAAHLVHIGLVLWLGRILHRAPLQGRLLIFFTIAIVVTYLLAVLSFGTLHEALSPGGWRGLKFLGLNYILLAFSRDFVLGALHSAPADQGLVHTMNYAPFAAMCIAAPILRFAAAVRSRSQIRTISVSHRARPFCSPIAEDSGVRPDSDEITRCCGRGHHTA